MTYNTELQREVEDLQDKLKAANSLLRFYIEKYNEARKRVEELEEQLRGQ